MRLEVHHESLVSVSTVDSPKADQRGCDTRNCLPDFGYHTHTFSKT